MAKLAGKIAWITGAGSGIGEAAALALAKEGATVVLTGRRKEPLETASRAADPASGGAAHVQPGDLMKPPQVRRSPPSSRRNSAASTSWSTMPGSTSRSGTGTS